MLAAKSTLMMIVLLVLSLYLWRESCLITGFSVILLVPLSVILFLGVYRPAIRMHRAKMAAAIISDTKLSKLLSGKLFTIGFSFIFTLIAVMVLAWQALTITTAETAVLLILCLLASGLSLWTQAQLAGSMHPPFARSMGMALGYAVVAFICVFVLAWINWKFVSHPGYIQLSGLPEAIDRSVDERQCRDGLITGMLAFFLALDTIKIWLVVHIDDSLWIKVLYCIDAALVTFIVAKSSVAVTDFFSNGLDNQQ